MDQFEEFWKPFFETNGYAGVWKRRTQGTAQKKDGCGLFYKRARYELLASKGIEYNDLAFGKECAGQDGCDDGFFLACAESQKNPTLETLAAASPENDAADAIAALPPDKKKKPSRLRRGACGAPGEIGGDGNWGRYFWGRYPRRGRNRFRKRGIPRPHKRKQKQTSRDRVHAPFLGPGVSRSQAGAE
mmetsp:Transcript_5989/g.22663  ORF Transcript_5989/g.22663 Transcript_5989/m.22663 type:complete len:188 (+) Transcript_5989:162-725(+)